jgi:catechol 2,3-dioxygenase-like lactoylglutathione lyase family enzyme
VLIRKLTLQTESPKCAAEFYRDVLGVEIDATGDSSSVVAGATTIEFRESPAGERPIYHLAFNVPPNHFMDAVRWLRARVPLLKVNGEEIFEFAGWHAHAVYFYDAAGNLLEFIARHGLPETNSSVAFGPAGILNVSELGVPAPDVLAAADYLGSEFAIPAYHALDESFAPMGDAHGLIILVREGREWHPHTGLLASDFPAEIVVDGMSARSGVIPGSLCKITASPRP